MWKAMLDFGGNFIRRHCSLHLNRFNSLFVYQLLPFVPLWYSGWCILGDDNDLHVYGLDSVPFLFFLSWKSHTILQRVEHIWSFERNSLTGWKHFCQFFHTSTTWLSNPFERAQCFSSDSVRLGVETWNIILQVQSVTWYHCLIKEWPFPTFVVIFRIGSKFTWKSQS